MNTALLFIHKVADKIINPLIVLMFALAVIVFLYGVLKYITNADKETERKKGNEHIIWGIVGMFIMISAYGIVDLILRSVGTTPEAVQLDKIKK